MNNKIKKVLVLSAMLILFAVLCISASASNGISSFAVNTFEAADTSSLGAEKWWKNPNNESYYIFLPNGFDKSNVTVWFTSDSDVYCGTTKLVSGTSTQAFASGRSFTITSGDKSYNLIFMQSSGIATAYINTESGNLDYVYADKENKESGTALIVGLDGKKQYDGALEYIKGRGNSTWALDKKPFNIKLDEKSNLFGMGKSKKWCLLANAGEATLIRNQLMYDFAYNIGVPSSSQSTQVNLYINGVYQGAYSIMEKVEIDKNRIEIYDLEGATEDVNENDLDTYALAGAQNSREWGSIKYANIPNNPEEITGGYLLELEKIYRYTAEASGFITNNGQAVVVKTPEYASKAQIEYISQFYQEFEDAFYSPDGKNALGKSYTDYIDIESLAKMYLMDEFGENFDGCSSSFYLYKDVDGKLTAGPIWDFDLSLGCNMPNDLINHVTSTGIADQLYIGTCFIGNHNERNYGLLAQALMHDDFRKEVKKVWAENFAPYYSKFAENVAVYSTTINSSAAMNAVRWNVFGTMDEGAITSNYAGSVQWVKDFSTARYNYLSDVFSPDSYMLRYDIGQYGKSLVNDTTIYKYGTFATLKSVESNKKGIIFDCWSTNPDGTGTTYNAGDTMEMGADTTLYANWKLDNSLSGILARLMDAVATFFAKIKAFFNVLFK